VARLVERIEEVPMPARTLLNVNVPACSPEGVEVTSLGKRIYRDELKLEQEERGRRRYWIYGADPGYEDEPGTDLAAVAAGRIAVTPIHFDLTDRRSLEALRRFDLDGLLEPPVRDTAP
jgi:5'-nucleotidase